MALCILTHLVIEQPSEVDTIIYFTFEESEAQRAYRT